MAGYAGKIAIGAGIVSLIFSIPIVLGFGPGGIALDSIAAAIQSSIGNVATGSIFSIFQSLGMTGFFTGIATKAVAIAGIFGAIALKKKDG